jgi:hypothetical protein
MAARPPRWCMASATATGSWRGASTASTRRVGQCGAGRWLPHRWPHAQSASPPRIEDERNTSRFTSLPWTMLKRIQMVRQCDGDNLTFSSYSDDRQSWLSIERADNVLEVIERDDNDSTVWFFIDEEHIYTRPKRHYLGTRLFRRDMRNRRFGCQNGNCTYGTNSRN